MFEVATLLATHAITTNSVPFEQGVIISLKEILNLFVLFNLLEQC